MNLKQAPEPLSWSLGCLRIHSSECQFLLKRMGTLLPKTQGLLSILAPASEQPPREHLERLLPLSVQLSHRNNNLRRRLFRKNNLRKQLNPIFLFLKQQVSGFFALISIYLFFRPRHRFNFLFYLYFSYSNHAFSS